jgi:RimJ/RimL family protein N-acetyltransferase
MHLETERLLIRPWTHADLDAAWAMYGDAEVMRYVGTGQPVATREELGPRLDRLITLERPAPQGHWPVEIKATGEVVGGCAILAIADSDDVEVAYHFAKHAWGKGYATEATRALVEYAFANSDLPRLVGVTYPQNAPSQRVLLKAGFMSVGRSMYHEIEVERFEIKRP